MDTCTQIRRNFISNIFFLPPPGPVSRPPVGFGDNEDVREAYLSTDQLSETSGLPPPLVDNDLSFDHEKDLQLSLCPSKSCPEGLFDDSRGMYLSYVGLFMY